jgi:hypothetical protein
MNDFESAPGRAVPQEEEILQQLTRILEAPTLRKSEVLRNILICLANRAAQDPDYRLKEHEIATRALGRTDNFDSRLDSAVRVHIARMVRSSSALAGLSPVIRIISLTNELIRMTLEAWPPDPFPKSPLPRRFQPTPK